MDIVIFEKYLTFTEWYHYAFLFIWLLLLFAGLKYFDAIESFFEAREDFHKGRKYSVYLLLGSFCLGVSLFLVKVFQPTDQTNPTHSFIEYSIIAIFLLLLSFSIVLAIKKYKPKSLPLRLIGMTLLMLVYFYSGILGGLLVVAVLALIFIIYVFIKFKNILTIK